MSIDVDIDIAMHVHVAVDVDIAMDVNVVMDVDASVDTPSISAGFQYRGRPYHEQSKEDTKPAPASKFSRKKLLFGTDVLTSSRSRSGLRSWTSTTLLNCAISPGSTSRSCQISAVTRNCLAFAR